MAFLRISHSFLALRIFAAARGICLLAKLCPLHQICLQEDFCIQQRSKRYFKGFDLQENQAESKRSEEECPSQHVLVMFPPWSKAIHF